MRSKSFSAQALELGPGLVEAAEIGEDRGLGVVPSVGSELGQVGDRLGDLGQTALLAVDRQRLHGEKLLRQGLAGALAPRPRLEGQLLGLLEAAVDHRPHPTQDRDVPEVGGLAQLGGEAGVGVEVAVDRGVCRRGRGGC